MLVPLRPREKEEEEERHEAINAQAAGPAAYQRKETTTEKKPKKHHKSHAHSTRKLRNNEQAVRGGRLQHLFRSYLWPGEHNPSWHRTLVRQGSKEERAVNTPCSKAPCLETKQPPLHSLLRSKSLIPTGEAGYPEQGSQGLLEKLAGLRQLKDGVTEYPPKTLRKARKTGGGGDSKGGSHSDISWPCQG